MNTQHRDGRFHRILVLALLLAFTTARCRSNPTTSWIIRADIPPNERYISFESSYNAGWKILSGTECISRESQVSWKFFHNSAPPTLILNDHLQGVPNFVPLYCMPTVQTPPVATPDIARSPQSVPSPPTSSPSQSVPISSVSPPFSQPASNRVFIFSFPNAILPSSQVVETLEISLGWRLGASVKLLFWLEQSKKRSSVVFAQLTVPTDELFLSIATNQTRSDEIKEIIASFLVTDTPSIQAPIPLSNSETPSGSNSTMVIAIIVAACTFVGIVVAIAVVIVRRRRRDSAQGSPNHNESASGESRELSVLNSSGSHEYGSLVLPEEDPLADLREEWKIDFADLDFGEKLGAGAFGVVYKGQYAGSEVAIKQCALNVTTDGLQEFKREATLMLGLKRHPNILSVIGISKNEQNIYMVLEYCDSGSLDKQVFADKLTLDEKLQVLSSVAKALAHLHRSKVIHRDIAARNVLLSSSKRGLQVKLADFGMSRIIDAYQDTGTTQALFGPVRYMAPESLKNKVYSTMTDVWSFGILVYEVICGKPPHSEMDILTAGVKIRDEGLSPELPEYTPAWLVSICNSCWALKPAQRPQMAEIVQIFKHSLSQGSTESLLSLQSTLSSTPTTGSNTSLTLSTANSLPQ